MIIRDDNDKIINLSFIKDINNYQNENKKLIILVYENNNHFNIAYNNIIKLDMKFKTYFKKSKQLNYKRW